MQNSTLIFGPPGCGKTYTLIEHVRKALAEGIHPSRIGFVSFTRKAIGEAVDRACSEFKLEKKELPYFKTMHSIAFHNLGLQSTDMINKDDWRQLGKNLGMVFDGVDNVSPDDGILIPPVDGSGSKYIQLITRSRYRRVPLVQEYNEAEDHSISFPMLQKIDETLREYKAETNKMDFADLIEMYSTTTSPSLDLLIVDEAQDLTPMQWDMVEYMSEKAERVIFAGDDDQAIHRWTGVDVSLFMKCSDDVVILDQSYRMPRRVHKLAQTVVKKISKRKIKQFRPTSEEGEVHFHMSLDSVPLDQGSWTLMTRTNKMARNFAAILREEGYLYSYKGHPSIGADVAETMSTWKQLQLGEHLPLDQVVKFYKAVPKQGDFAVVKRGASTLLEASRDDALLGYDDLVRDYGLVAPKTRDPMDVAKLGLDDKLYIKALERRGEDITKPPRLKVSTFHAMKGGEDDNCVVYLGSTWACINTKHPDDEHRAFYVGITRARKTLHIVDTDKKYRYEL